MSNGGQGLLGAPLLVEGLQLLVEVVGVSAEGFGVLPSGLGHLHTEERLERLGELARDAALVVHEDALEDRLVHLATDGRSCPEVRLLPMSGVVEGRAQVLLDVVEPDGGGSDADLGCVEGCRDAQLLGLEPLGRDDLVVVGLKKLVLLVFESSPSLLLGRAFLLGGCTVQLDLVQDEGANLVEQLGCRLHMGVVVLDPGFDVVDTDCTLFAERAPLLTPDADEVLVDLASPSLVVRNDQARPAAAAEHGALEVVVVLSLLLTGAALAFEHLGVPPLRETRVVVSSGCS
ncbi:MAG: hypothetical protein AAGA99_25785 [Actinomycetota bacterium]